MPGQMLRQSVEHPIDLRVITEIAAASTQRSMSAAAALSGCGPFAAATEPAP